MTPQERDLIQGVAERLRNAGPIDKDREAEQFIKASIGSNPDALYLLTQAVIVQEQGLLHAQERIQQLESQQPSRSGGFLSGLFGGGKSAPPEQAYVPPGQPVQAASGGFGSFMKTAAATAAGVVGAHLIFDGLRNAFGHGVLPSTGGGYLGGMGDQAPNIGDSAFHTGGGALETVDYQPDDDDYDGGGGDFDQDDGGSGSADDDYSGDGGSF